MEEMGNRHNKGKEPALVCEPHHLIERHHLYLNKRSSADMQDSHHRVQMRSLALSFLYLEIHSGSMILRNLRADVIIESSQK